MSLLIGSASTSISCRRDCVNENRQFQSSDLAFYFHNTALLASERGWYWLHFIRHNYFSQACRYVGAARVVILFDDFVLRRQRLRLQSAEPNSSETRCFMGLTLSSVSFNFLPMLIFQKCMLG